jgi:hypothetical protein
MLDRRRRPLRSDQLQPTVLSRLIVGLALIAGGIVWAIARGLAYNGLSPVHIVYDLDQPPVLLLLVGAWLLYRSRRR